MRCLTHRICVFPSHRICISPPLLINPQPSIAHSLQLAPLLRRACRRVDLPCRAGAGQGKEGAAGDGSGASGSCLRAQVLVVWRLSGVWVKAKVVVLVLQGCGGVVGCVWCVVAW